VDRVLGQAVLPPHLSQAHSRFSARDRRHARTICFHLTGLVNVITWTLFFALAATQLFRRDTARV